MTKPCIYLIGSLRDKRIPEVGNYLEQNSDIEIFSDWYSASEDADDWLRDYYRGRGYDYKQMVYSHAAKHIFSFDLYHLDRSVAGVLVAPAGKSCHLELGYLRGQGKPTYVLFDKEPERVDIMYNFCTNIFFNQEDLLNELKKLSGAGTPGSDGSRLLGQSEQSGEDRAYALRAVGSPGSSKETGYGQQAFEFLSRSSRNG